MYSISCRELNQISLLYDAAGGASSKADQGWGVVNLNAMEWARGSWPAYILENSVHLGAQWGRRLSFLEGFTGVIAVPLWASEIQEAGGAALMIDNLGFCYANQSGCSTDEIIWTLSKCLATLAEGLGVQIKVFHTGRRTSLGDKVADDLSKGKIGQVMVDIPGSRNISDRVSRTMLTWLRKPKVEMELGRSVLKELAARPGLNVHVGFSYRSAALELGVDC